LAPFSTLNTYKVREDWLTSTFGASERFTDLSDGVVDADAPLATTNIETASTTMASGAALRPPDDSCVDTLFSFDIWLLWSLARVVRWLEWVYRRVDVIVHGVSSTRWRRRW
jgi:hypothetical protein